MKTRLTQRMLSVLAGALAITALALPTSAFALCSGAQVLQLNDKPTQCAGHGAFKTDKSSLFICAQTDLQMRMITSAFLAGRTISFTLDNPNPSDQCAANGASYAAKTTDLYVN